VDKVRNWSSSLVLTLSKWEVCLPETSLLRVHLYSSVLLAAAQTNGFRPERLPIALLLWGGSRWTTNYASSRLHRQHRMAVDDLTCVARIKSDIALASTCPICESGQPAALVGLSRVRYLSARRGFNALRPSRPDKLKRLHWFPVDAESKDGAMADFLFHRHACGLRLVAVKSGHDPGHTRLRSNRYPCMSQGANGPVWRVFSWTAVRIGTLVTLANHQYHQQQPAVETLDSQLCGVEVFMAMFRDTFLGTTLLADLLSSASSHLSGLVSRHVPNTAVHVVVVVEAGQWCCEMAVNPRSLFSTATRNRQGLE
jgi:hypothetical protein